MPEPVDYPSEFENLLQTAMAASEPDPAFMDSLRSQFHTRQHAQQRKFFCSLRRGTRCGRRRQEFGHGSGFFYATA